jgi:hypothetical protein
MGGPRDPSDPLSIGKAAIGGLDEHTRRFFDEDIELNRHEKDKESL